MQCSHRGLNILDTAARILELPWIAVALTKAAVIECEPQEATCRHRLGINARSLLLHRRERAGRDDDASGRSLRRRKQVADQALAVAGEVESFHGCDVAIH